MFQVGDVVHHVTNSNLPQDFIFIPQKFIEKNINEYIEKLK